MVEEDTCLIAWCPPLSFISIIENWRVKIG